MAEIRTVLQLAHLRMSDDWRERLVRRERLERALVRRFPKMSVRLARCLADAFSGRGMEAILLASDAEIGRANGIGPHRLGEYRRLWPAPASDPSAVAFDVREARNRLLRQPEGVR